LIVPRLDGSLVASPYPYTKVDSILYIFYTYDMKAQTLILWKRPTCIKLWNSNSQKCNFFYFYRVQIGNSQLGPDPKVTFPISNMAHNAHTIHFEHHMLKEAKTWGILLIQELSAYNSNLSHFVTAQLWSSQRTLGNDLSKVRSISWLQLNKGGWVIWHSGVFYSIQQNVFLLEPSGDLVNSLVH
jgi:hypothetical protein